MGEVVISWVLGAVAAVISFILHVVYGVDEIDFFKSYVGDWALLLFLVLLVLSVVLFYHITFIVSELMFNRPGLNDPGPLFCGFSASLLFILVAGLFGKSIAHMWKKVLKNFTDEVGFAILLTIISICACSMLVGLLIFLILKRGG